MGTTYSCCCRLLIALLIVDLISVASLIKAENNFSPAKPSQKTSLQKLITGKNPKKKQKLKFAELPGGGRRFAADTYLVALYGTPGDSQLGVLGEQSLEDSIKRVKQMAIDYKQQTGKKIMPTFEIITTVASAEPTEDGDYSREIDLNVLEQWIKQAQEKNVYVVLDLQPGHSDFLKQAKQFEYLLRYPNVGLALDPEWRLRPGGVHLESIGTVDAAEVNSVSAWLSELVQKNKLPQKIFLLHQFRLDMITNSQNLVMNYPELNYLIQMDGHGNQMTKLDSWNVIKSNYPATTSFGWKNFIDEDEPMLTPGETMMRTPAPKFVSYQ